MKKQDRIGTTLHTNIEDIQAIGNELSDEHLRLVSGAGKKTKQTYTGRTYINCCWYRRDYQTDTVYVLDGPLKGHKL